MGCNCKNVNHSMQTVRSSNKEPEILFIGDLLVETDGLLNNPAGDFLQLFLSQLTENNICEWAYTNIVNCPFTKEQISEELLAHCFKNNVLGLIGELNPKIIICLGSTAYKLLLPAEAESSGITKARKKIYNFGRTQVLVTYSPQMHVYYEQSGKKIGEDLFDEYIRVFSLIERIMKGEEVTKKENIYVISSDKDLQYLRHDLLSKELISIDTETNQWEDIPELCNPYKEKFEVLCLGVALDEENAYVIPQKFLNKPLISEITENRVLVQSNIKYDLKVLKLKYDIDFNFKGLEDTYLMAYAIDQLAMFTGLKSQVNKYNLGEPDWDKEVYDYLSSLQYEKYTKMIKGEEKELVRKLQYGEYGVPCFADVEPSILYRYNGRDVLYCLRLLNYLKANKKIPPVYSQLLIPSITPLLKMELNGIPISKEYLLNYEKALERAIEQNVKIFETFPEVQQVKTQGGTKGCVEANPKSSDFLRALASIQGLESKYKTKKKGEQSINGKTIEDWSKNNIVWEYIKTIRDDRYMITNFITRLKNQIVNGHIHTDFKLGKDSKDNTEKGSGGGTASGRLASEPNLQNLKKDNMFLKSFEAPEGYSFVIFDYPQMELRILADQANIKQMKEAFNQNKDLHRLMASYIYNKPLAEITDTERDMGKTANFSLVYGKGIKTFARDNDISVRLAEQIFTAVGKLYPEIKQWKLDNSIRLKSRLPLITRFGREIKFTLTGEEYKDAEIERQFNNYGIQATASDILCQKQREITEKYEGNPDLIQVDIVHDALWVLIRNSELDRITIDICRILSDRSTLPWNLTVPITVNEVKIGKSLGEMKKRKVGFK